MADKNNVKGAASIAITKKKINDAFDKAEKTKGKNRAYFKEVGKIYQDELKGLKKQYPEAGVKQGPKKKINKKAVGKGPRLGGEFTGPRKNVLKRLNMGGAIMKNRGGMFKGSY